MHRFLIAAGVAGLVAASGAAHAQMPAPADIIKAWDANGDGAVSKDEWVAAGRPAERFALVDANHDGKVTAAELEAAMAKMRQGGAR
ncbi:MAG: EF-hand domain-containing protein [Phenylobacterium sp.]|uniref:EF-hand domain-containing protein n=1 Tax=Phenylobacterium sp. TaxID=1871053 RepID=UPI0025F19356|nr:EF-hand domain-containing protein [Phenylobacterium sp.]MBI1200314.1 EF-hand domain-containing protein [Phenylobacterium sp.]